MLAAAKLATLAEVRSEAERLGIAVPKRLVTPGGELFEDTEPLGCSPPADSPLTLADLVREMSALPWVPAYTSSTFMGVAEAPAAPPPPPPPPPTRSVRVRFAGEALVEVPVDWDESVILAAVRGRWLDGAESRSGPKTTRARSG
jgi:hypothetical protein